MSADLEAELVNRLKRLEGQVKDTTKEVDRMGRSFESGLGASGNAVDSVAGKLAGMAARWASVGAAATVAIGFMDNLRTKTLADGASTLSQSAKTRSFLNVPGARESMAAAGAYLGPDDAATAARSFLGAAGQAGRGREAFAKGVGLAGLAPVLGWDPTQVATLAGWATRAKVPSEQQADLVAGLIGQWGDKADEKARAMGAGALRATALRSRGSFLKATGQLDEVDFLELQERSMKMQDAWGDANDIDAARKRVEATRKSLSPAGKAFALIPGGERLLSVLDNSANLVSPELDFSINQAALGGGSPTWARLPAAARRSLEDIAIRSQPEMRGFNAPRLDDVDIDARRAAIPIEALDAALRSLIEQRRTDLGYDPAAVLTNPTDDPSTRPPVRVQLDKPDLRPVGEH
jgi:hypothetical protein